MAILPPFGLLWANHPTDHDPEAVKRMIGGRVNLPWITNTCAIRMSHALNHAGSPIPKRHPSLSTVEPGRDEIAQVAVDMLVERINEKGDPMPPRQILADYRIVGRESTGFSHPMEHTGAIGPLPE